MAWLVPSWCCSSYRRLLCCSYRLDEARKRRQEKIEASKEEIQNLDERAAQSRAAGQAASGSQQPQRPQVTETIVREQPKIGVERNSYQWIAIQVTSKEETPD